MGSLVTVAPEFDDFNRFANIFNYYPNGSSGRTVKHLLKGMHTGRFEKYTAEWNDSLREKIYSYYPVDLSKLRYSEVPIAMIYALDDALSSAADSQILVHQIRPTFLKTIRGGHATFLVGKDMTYFTQDVIGLLQKYHSLS